jgi:general stress protein 26
MTDYPEAEPPHLHGDAALAKVRKLLSSFESAMLVTIALEHGDVHARPLGLLGKAADFDGTLWFFADTRSRKVQEIERDPRASLILQSDHDSRYLQLSGVARIEANRQKMEELYTARQRTWFPDGLADQHLTLIRFDAVHGSYWDSPGSVLQTLAAFTAAIVTHTPQETGRSGTLEVSGRTGRG